MAFNKAKALQEAEKLVIQGKISQAIKQYFDIFEKDPSDVVLLNTIGDLYIRDRNVPEGLKQFYRLAEAYSQGGFTLKAIAIYKKIVKLEPDSVDPLLRLVELYQAQRLGREARELYYQIAECYKKKKQHDKALETLRKVLQFDVESATARARLAAFCEEIGRKDEAAQVYLETAQLAFRRGETAAVQSALDKAQELDPANPQIQLLRARQALALKQPEEVEAILSVAPGLRDDPAARSLLIDSYLAIQRPEKAETLVLDLFHSNPADFSPLASFVSVCMQAGQFDTASKALSGLADQLIEQGNTSSLMESLRLIWSKSPQHLPTLELIFRICDQTGDEYTLPEILEALGRAYLQCGQFEKAKSAFQRLVDREPENERYEALLRRVPQKWGEEFGKAHVADLPASPTAPTLEEVVAAPAASALAAADREAMVKEALENSELLAHYHLMRKAVAELDRVLEIYPDETEIHKRLAGMCWRDMPERAEQAVQALVRIYTQRGDAEAAKRFAQMVGGRAAPAESLEPLAPLPGQPAATAAGETSLASEVLPTPVPVAEAAPTPHLSSTASAEVTFQLPRLPEQEAPAATPAQIPFDVSAAPGVESLATTPRGASLHPSIPAAPKAPPSAALDLPIDLATPASSAPPPAPLESPIDLATLASFAPPPAPLESLIDLATSASSAPPPAPLESLIDLATLASSAPPPAPLESLIDLATLASSAPPLAPSSEIDEIDLLEDWESFQAQVATASVAPETPPEVASFNYQDSRIEVNFYLEHGFVEEARKAVEELERALPGDPRIGELRALVEAPTGARAAEVDEKPPAEILQPRQPEAVAPPAKEAVEQRELASSYAAPKPEAKPAAVPALSPREEEIPTEATPGVTVKAMPNLLGELADAFGSAMGGLEEPPPPPAPRSAPTAGPGTRFTAPTPAPASSLSGLLEEIGGALGTETVQEDDPETHYNLGVAFREMNLLDEAIGEFQKVVRGGGKKPHLPNYLQACTLLATCFMDKGMAPLAVKWYCRALETPDIDEEALLALQYDLGVAYEQAGDLPRALEKFTEVYGQNIDYRDVAEKIRIFQQKGS
jgi:tetratricopeptide (TPR) repeat protein